MSAASPRGACVQGVHAAHLRRRGYAGIPLLELPFNLRRTRRERHPRPEGQTAVRDVPAARGGARGAVGELRVNRLGSRRERGDGQGVAVRPRGELHNIYPTVLLPQLRKAVCQGSQGVLHGRRAVLPPPRHPRHATGGPRSGFRRAFREHGGCGHPQDAA